MTLRHAFIPAFVGLAALGATCKGTDTKTDRPPATAAEPQQAPPITALDRIPAVTEIEGLDLSEIEPARRAEFLRLLNDTYCYCGCPRTLAACLGNRSDCSCVKCSERMARFIISEFRDGASNDDVEAQLLEGFSEGFNGRPITFDTSNQPARGPSDAKYTVVEFADFRCPHCAGAAEVLDEIMERRSDVRLVYYYFPLSGGGERSIRAAEAAEEARAQGKFWEMARTLFRSQHALEDEDLERYASQVGLEMERFRTALKNRSHREKILTDKRAGETANVQSTPALFVNGRPFGLARTLDNIEMRLAMEADRGRCD